MSEITKLMITLAACACLMASPIFQTAQGTVTDKWSDGSTDITFTSPLTSGSQMLTNFTIAKHSVVSSANLRIRNEVYYMDEGLEYQTTHWPTNPSMDLFNDGTVEWSFPGKMGLQNYFGNETTDADLKWEQSGTVKSLEFTVPKSTVLGASLLICNTQTSKYGYQLKVGETPVWSKDSL